MNRAAAAREAGARKKTSASSPALSAPRCMDSHWRCGTPHSPPATSRLASGNTRPGKGQDDMATRFIQHAGEPHPPGLARKKGPLVLCPDAEDQGTPCAQEILELPAGNYLPPAAFSICVTSSSVRDTPPPTNPSVPTRKRPACRTGLMFRMSSTPALIKRCPRKLT